MVRYVLNKSLRQADIIEDLSIQITTLNKQ